MQGSPQQIIFQCNLQESSSEDSLDLLLPKLHAQTPEKRDILLTECSINKYLKGLGLRFKTDPCEKQHKYYENFHIQIVKESLSPLTPVAPTTPKLPPPKPQLTQQKSFSVLENPLRARRSLQ